MFHVELRQFPHVARAFNWSREELDGRVLRRWVQGLAIELDDRRWEPDRAKLAVYEGRALDPSEIGMGRGWGNVTRSAEPVTDRVLTEARQALQAPPALAELKRELSARATVGMDEVLALAAQLAPDLSDGDRLALARRAVLELLSEGVVKLTPA
jgi:hypothetical protein